MEVVTGLCTYRSIIKVHNQNHGISLAGISRRLDGTGILCSAKESIPRGQVKKHLPFWNEFLGLLKSERNAARCRAENSHNIADCILLRKAQAKLKHAIILSRRTTYSNQQASHNRERSKIDLRLRSCPKPNSEQGSPFLNKDFCYDELLFATNSMEKGKFAGPLMWFPQNSSLTFVRWL
ncbi:hypothetical protein TNCV_2468811 [Trichonephila clavipes]|nr:hypothetical protein TNCV_2468811 [Trichonephila clavipes]